MSELVAELLFLLFSLSWWIDSQWETSHSLNYSQEQVMGDQFVWGTPLLLKPTPFLGFGYGCPGGRLLDLCVPLASATLSVRH